MNEQRKSIFYSDLSLDEKLRDSLKDVAKKPYKISLLFWLFFLQLCIAVFLLLCSIILPFIILM